MSLTVPVPVGLAYQVWADIERYPEWMGHLERVERTGERTSRWTMRTPAGRTLHWTTETTVLRPNEKIAWSSLDGDLVTYGSVEFESVGPRRSRISVRRFHGVGRGHDPAALAPLGDPAKSLSQDLHGFLDRLRRLHQEALRRGQQGGSPAGTRDGTAGPHTVARPPETGPLAGQA